MTDSEYYGKIFSDSEILARVMLVSLTAGSVLEDLSDGKRFTSKTTSAFKDITIFRGSGLSIMLGAQYVRNEKGNFDTALPTIQIFPDAIIHHESRAVILMDPNFHLIEGYFDMGLDYEYVSNGGNEGYALSTSTLMRLYSIADLKLRYHSLLHMIRRAVFDITTYLAALKFNPFEIHKEV